MILRKIYRRLRLEISKKFRSNREISIQSLKIEGLVLLAKINEDVGRSMKIFRSYEVPETRFFQSVIEDGDICFDIGGNIGFFAALMAAAAKNTQVYCFEPISLNTKLIEISIQLNSLNNVTVENIAIGSKNGETEFVISEDSAYSSILDTGRSPHHATCKVPLRTLDSYVAEKGIPKVNLLKVDVEGAEADVIRGAMKTLSDSTKRPRYIMMELAGSNLATFGENIESVVAMLEELDYQANSITVNGELVPVQPGDFSRHYNFVFSVR